MAKASSNIDSRDVEYRAAGETLRGYFACGTGDGARPAIAVVHEWWGVNDYIRERVRMLAALGYAAMALDMYGAGKVAADSDEAGSLMNAALGDVARFEARLQAGLDCLGAQVEVDGTRMGAVGYCFGGATVLHAARMGLPLGGVVSFHGSLGSLCSIEAGKTHPKVLVCHGAADVLVPDADVAAFRAEMGGAGIDYELVAYDGALHGFTSREADANAKKYGLPLGYSAEADSQSWQAMQTFFKACL